MDEEVVTTTDTTAAEPVSTPASDAGADQAQPATQEAQNAAPVPSEGLWQEEKSEGEDEEPKDEQAAVAYDFNELQPAGEGYQVDKPTAEAFGKIAQEVGLDQKGFATMFNKLMPYLNQRQSEQLEGVKRTFIAQAKADPDMGGSDEKWRETLGLARKAFTKFTDAPTREILRASGLDCHPGIIKMFLNIQRAMSDDVMVNGQAAATKGDPAKRFFYNTQY